MLARLIGLPALQAGVLAARAGLIWLMLVAVLGPRAARALAQSDGPAAPVDPPAPARDVPDDGTAATHRDE